MTEDEWLDGINDSMDMSLSSLQEMVKDSETWHTVVHVAARVGHNLATKQQQPIPDILVLSKSFPGYFLTTGPVVKNLPSNMRNTGLIPALGN